MYQTYTYTYTMIDRETTAKAVKFLLENPQAEYYLVDPCIYDSTTTDRKETEEEEALTKEGEDLLASFMD